ncbi:MAG: hypothetical protein M9894_11905 [Planctomycetes bacterium]|nr:hypothetical protein [Planctomycetota bacterium]
MRPVGRAVAPGATAGGAPATSLAAGAPAQVLLGRAQASAAPAGARGALDPALLGLLGQGPMRRGASGVGWLGPRTSARLDASPARDPSGALPLPLREFVRGGAVPVRVGATSDVGALPGAAPAAAAAGPTAPPAPARDEELIRPAAPVQIVPGAGAQGPGRAPDVAPGEAGPMPAPSRRVAAPRRSGASRRVDMEHTSLVAGAAGGGVLRKHDAVDAEGGGDAGELRPAREASSTQAAVPTPPADLSLLVNQIYAQLKRELLIERERKG